MRIHSRQLLAATADVKVEHRSLLHVEPIERQPPRPPQPRPAAKVQTKAEIEALRLRDWNRFVDARVAHALVKRDESLTALRQDFEVHRGAIRHLIADARRALAERDREIADLKERVGNLVSEVSALGMRVPGERSGRPPPVPVECLIQ